MRRTVIATTMLTFLFAAVPAMGQQPDFVPEKLDVAAKGKEPGWHPMLKGAATAAFGNVSNVVGADDGSTWNLGLVVNGGLDWRHAAGHTWENSLKWQLTYMRTPAIDLFVKSLDSFDFSSTYFYELPQISWMGPFASFRLLTAVLPGAAVRPGAVTVEKFASNGDAIGMGTGEVIAGGEQIDLTEAFAPTTVRESVGFFANPFARKYLEVKGRLGGGAWETFTSDGFTIDKEEGGLLTLKQMQDSTQVGAEAEIVLKGILAGNVSYSLKAGVMYPCYHNATTELEGADLLNTELEAILGVKLAEWASLNYNFKALKYPLIVDDWQVANSLLLTLTASIL